MQEEKGAIKCVDFGLLGTNLPDENLQAEFLRVGKEISNAFEDIGFVYLINHGIPESLIKDVHECGSKFFSSSKETKMKYSKDTNFNHGGYVAINREKLDNGVLEIRESYDINRMNGLFPEEIKHFESKLRELIKQGIGLSNKLLRALEMGLGIAPYTLVNAHRTPFIDNNGSIFRLLHYPPVSEQVKEGSVRCGIHSDYGTFTLLFQDDMGGLEVKDRDGIWQHADPITDAILINVGDLLEMWTSGRFVATQHKVLIPKNEIQRRCSRRSMALFLHPENDVVVQPFENSSPTYPPIRAEQHLQNRLAATYQY